MRTRIQESQINADPDPGEPNQCGYESRRANSMRIRIQERQSNADPDPKHWPVVVGISVLVIKTLDPDRYSA